MIRLTGFERFSAKDRLRARADFERVYQRRCAASDTLLLLYVRDNGLPYSRLGLSVSRKVGGAVLRNRWKRLIREAFRLSRAELPCGVDIIAIPRPNAQPALEPLKRSLAKLTTQAATRLGRG